MRRFHLGWVTLCTLLVACQANVGGVDPAGRAKKPVTPAATAKPGPAASTGAPSAMPVAATMLSGMVKMDAGYVVSAGGGNVIAAGGANVVSAGGGNLIRVGGQVISAGGANAVSAGGANFRTLASALAFGDMLPARGMVVVAVSLRTGEPLGQAVLTNDAGRYTLAIPKSETGNVRIVAAVPGKSDTDPVLSNARLQSEALTTGAAAAEVVVDDDRALVSRYFRQAFVTRMGGLLNKRTPDVGEPKTAEEAFFRQVWGELAAAAVAAKSADWPADRRQAVAQRLADAVIYYVDFASAKVNRDKANWENPQEETCFDAYLDIMRRFRLGALQRIAADPRFLEKQTYMQGQAASIERGVELGEHIARTYLGESKRYDELKDVFATVGLDRREGNRLKAAEEGLITAIGLTLVTNADAKAALLELIRTEGQR
jgi:hypothetical protein